jgi:hypothetical protein
MVEDLRWNGSNIAIQQVIVHTVSSPRFFESALALKTLEKAEERQKTVKSLKIENGVDN